MFEADTPFLRLAQSVSSMGVLLNNEAVALLLGSRPRHRLLAIYAHILLKPPSCPCQHLVLFLLLYVSSLYSNLHERVAFDPSAGRHL